MGRASLTRAALITGLIAAGLVGQPRNAPRYCADRFPQCNRERARGHRDHRSQTDGPDARRQADGDRRLSSEGHVEEISDHLRSHAVQLQLLGREARRAARHDAPNWTAVKRGYAYVEMNERGHFFSEGIYDILGAPLTDGDGCDHVDDVAAMVQRQGGHDRLLVHRGMAIGRGGAREPGVRRDDPARLRRGRGARGAVLRTGQLVSRRRGADALHRVAIWRAEPGAADVSRRTRRRRI